MPNAIKYSTSPQTLALKKGNFWIGTGDVDKGPTSLTDYWSGISPATGGYVIYLNKASQGPSIYTASGASELVSMTNMIAGTSFTASSECLNWFSTQTDKMVFNIDYPQISTNGLVLDVDAAFSPSYPATGSSWYDVSTNGVTGTLVNSPGYSITNGGSITFNGVNNFVTIPKQTSLVSANRFTISAWVKRTAVSSRISIWQGANDVNDVAIKLGSTGGSTGAFFEVGDSAVNTYGFVSNTSTATLNLAMVFDGTQSGNSNRLKGYINGTPQTLTYNGTIPATSGTVDSAFFVGNTGGYLTDGSVSSIQIYNRALSANEVLENYNAQLRIDYDASALAYITAAGFTDPALNNAINNFFIDLKATGHYSKISVMKLYITDSTNNVTSLTQMGINAVNPGTYNSTYFNAPTTSYSGMTMNGTNQYGLSNWNSSTDPLWGSFSASIMSYVGLDLGADIYNFGLRSVTAENVGLGLSTPTGNLFVGINDSTASLVFSAAANNAGGWRAGSRTANDSTKYYIWRTTIQTQTGVAVTAKANINSPENAYTTDGTTFPSYFNQRLQFMAAGSGISAEDLVTIGGIVNTFQGNLDTVFGLTGADARKRY